MKTNRKFRKPMSLLLALVMVFSLLPTAAFADETEAAETEPTAVVETAAAEALDATSEEREEAAEDAESLSPAVGSRFTIDLPIIPPIPEEVVELTEKFGFDGGKGLTAAKSYTVTLDCCGGVASDGGDSYTVAAYYNQFLPTIEVPTYVGMSFQGFFDGEDGTGDMYYDADGNSVTRWTQTEGGTLYAYWLPISYIITLIGGEFAPSYSGEVSVYYGEELQIPTMPFAEGHTFLGFFDAEEGGQQYVDGDGNCVRTWDKEAPATLYGHWETSVVTYTMTLDPNNGEPCTEIELEANGSLPENVEVPKRYGYTFSGYVLLNEDGSVSFRIYYDSKGERYTYLYAGVKTSYEWDGCSNIRLFATWMVSLISVQLKLNAPEGLTTGYTSNTGILINPDKVYATVGNMMPNLTCMPTCRFHEFLGYFSEAEGGQQYYTADGTPIHKMELSDEGPVLYAHWRPAAYQFKLDYNGGSYAGSNRTQYAALYYGQSAPDTDVIPTRTGFTFSGYYTVKPTNTLSDFSYQIIDREGDSLTYRTVGSDLLNGSDRTLYAGWIPVIYNIDYLDAGGGDYSGSVPSGWVTSFQYDDAITLPTPSRDGVSFLGWYLESDCSGAKITKIKPYTYAEDIVLYALWSDSPYAEGMTRGGGKRFIAPSPTPKGNDPLTPQEPQEPQKVETKVVLYANGGKFGSNNTSEITVTFGEVMPALTQLPTRSDYALAGFYDTKNGGNQYYDGNGNSVAIWDKTVKSTTLYAHWASERVEVTLDANGGTIPAGGVSKVTAVYGQPMPALGTLPTREGYVFLGYYADNAAGDVQYYRANGTSARKWDNGPTTLKAHWAKAELKGTVTWKNYDGTVLETDTGVVAGTVPTYNGAVPTHAPDGLYTYVFSGWTPAVTEFGGDITYTANFTRAEVIFNVTWTDEDGTVLGTSQAAAGTLPAYIGELPQKEGDVQYTYTFAGWSPELAPAMSDVTYVATYAATVNEYTVTWMNDDGIVIKTDEVPYGEKPEYGMSLPVSTVDAASTFVGWESSEYTPELDENGRIVRVLVAQADLAAYKPGVVTADVTYTAKYAVDECLNFTAVGGDVTVGMEVVGFKAEIAAGQSPYKVLYRFADSAEWTETNLQNTPLVIPEGETVYLRAAEIFSEICSGNGFRAFRCFTMDNGGGSGTIEANGNIMSLINILADDSAQELTRGEFAGLFYNCTLLTKAPKLSTAPIKAGVTEVYSRMFHGCTGLTEAPVIRACGAVGYNYYMMFAGCTNLNDVTVEFTDWDFDGGFNVVKNWLSGVAESGTFHCPVSLDTTVRDADHVPEGWVIDAGPCTVVWQDEDGNVLYTRDDYRVGDTPVYPNEDPSKSTDERYEYTFEGWEPEVAPLTAEETVYTAKFAKTDRLYTVTWMDVYTVPVSKFAARSCQVELYKAQFKYGEPTVYGGEAPARESTDMADYAFVGWSPEMAETVTRDTTYYAIFDEIKKEYTVTWQDEDGTVLGTQKFYYGDAPLYSGTAPTKAATEDYTYAFNGWSPALKPVTEDITYTATYTQSERLYSVTWADGDGYVLATDYYHYGETPVYSGVAPTKQATAQYQYTFKGIWLTPSVKIGQSDDGSPIMSWPEAVGPVTKDVVYVAQFDSTVRKYTVIWKDETTTGGSQFGGGGIGGNYVKMFYSAELEYGATPVYGGETPTKASDAHYDYVFNGWTPEMTTVTGSAIYTATYRAIPHTHTVTWQDIDGTVLATTTVGYGEMPVYSGETPTKESTAQYEYTFNGWTPELKTVTGDATYTATYSAAVREYEVRWEGGNGYTIYTESLPYGETPVFNDNEYRVHKTSTYTEQYVFNGQWSPEIAPVTGDVCYVPQFDTEPRSLSYMWVCCQDDLTIFISMDWTVYDEKSGVYGDEFVYEGETPTKKSDDMYTYTFVGWSEPVLLGRWESHDEYAYYAQFEPTLRKYTITWQDETPAGADYAETLYTADFDYGTMPVYGGETPTKPSDEHYDYVFDGWSSEMTTVTGNATYTATYRAIPHPYTVTWKDVDGTVLATTTVGYGEMPVYSGETPTKESTTQYKYTFNGWTPALTTVTDDAIYTATYTQSDILYSVTWADGDNRVLATEYYHYGETPVYKGATPTKQATAQYQYTFKGIWLTPSVKIGQSDDGSPIMSWPEAVGPVTKDVIYVAQFDSTVRKYTVIWKDETTTGGSQFVGGRIGGGNYVKMFYSAEFEYGATPVYGGETPTKASDAHYDYVFNGWTPEMTTVTDSAIYTATYRAIPHTHTVTWQDIDGTVLATTTVGYGEMPVYSGETPTKAPVEQYEYTFNGWTPELKTVTGDATYTATYSASVRKFEVRWVNGNNQLIYSESVSYGETPVFDEQYEENVSKYRTQSETYIFNGQWLPEPAPVTEPVTYVPQFRSKPTEMRYNWVCPDGEGGSICLAFKFGAYGDEFVYEGETPTLPDSDECRYVFVGWSEPVWTSAQLYLDVYELTALFEERPLEPDYLSFTARDDDMEIYMDISGSFTGNEIRPQLKYRIGKTGTWQDFEGKKTLVKVPQDETVYFGTDVSRTNLSKDMQWTFYSMGDGTLESGGSVMSLLDPEANPNATMDTGAFRGLFAWDGNYGMQITTAPDLPATNLSVSCYDSMFLGNKTLTSTANMGDGKNNVQLAAGACYSMYQNCINLEGTSSALPQVTNSEAVSCYAHMFDGCSKLLHPSDLSGSTVVPTGAFACMYKNCYALAEIPNMPTNATAVGEQAFACMFMGCTSLTDKLLDSTKPFAMPSATPGKEAYMEMFEGCTSLKIVPNLPAQTLGEGCYQMMFGDCSALSDVSACNISGVKNLAKNCFKFMFAGCSSLFIEPALPDVPLAEGCYAYMFDGCSSLTSAPWLPATELAPSCYEGMFMYCTSLKYAPAAKLSELPASYVPRTVAEYTQDYAGNSDGDMNATSIGISKSGAHYKLVTDLCYFGVDYPYLPAMTMEESCYAYMFKGCTSLEIAPELPAMSLAKRCYRGMFDGCTRLYGVPRLPAYTVYERSYAEMFKGCTSLWKAPELPARYVDNYSYQSMFSGCTELTVAPEIVAADGTDSYYVYNEMFSGCSKLNNLTVRFLTWPKNGNGTQNWLKGVSTNGTFNCYVDLDTTKTGVSGIPSKWSVNILTDEYLGFTAVDGDVKISMTRGNTGTAPALKYRLSTETSWHDFSSSAGTTVTVPSGNTVYFGTDVAYTSLNNDNFVMTRVDPNSNATVEASGSVTSLLDPTREHGHTVGELQNLFMNCTILTVAPELPAVNITNSKGYTAMFRGCTALREAPELPAYNVDTACYGFMFYDCTSLKEAPVLHLKNVTNSAYLRMFRNCTALESAEIYLESIDGACLSEMFAGCSALDELTMIFTDTSVLSNSKALNGFVNGVAANGTLYCSWKLQKALNELGSDDVKTSLGLPSGWTTVTQ